MMMMMIMMMMMKAVIIVVMMISCRFAIAGLRSLFGVLSKAVTDLKYLEKVTTFSHYLLTILYYTITFNEHTYLCDNLFIIIIIYHHHLIIINWINLYYLYIFNLCKTYYFNPNIIIIIVIIIMYLSLYIYTYLYIYIDIYQYIYISLYIYTTGSRYHIRNYRGEDGFWDIWYHYLRSITKSSCCDICAWIRSWIKSLFK